MDGLLIDSEPLWFEAMKQSLNTVGVRATKADHNKVLGIGIANTVAYFHHKQPWDKPSQKAMQKLIQKEAIKLITTKGAIMPGVKAVLDLFKSRKLPMAIASSSHYKVIDGVLDTLGIHGYFKVIYSGIHEEHSKPHPAVFLNTAKRLKVEPKHCLVFEDSPSGVLAAKVATMKCVAVPEDGVKDHKFIQTADRVLDSLEEFNAKMLDDL